MNTNKHTNLKCFLCVCFLFSIVILTACKPKASANKPFADLKEWDLLIISDSTNWGVGQYYAKLIEADMNVKVNLHDCWVGGLPTLKTLQILQSGKWLSPDLGDQSCQKPWSDLVKEAEVIVLFGNPVDSDFPEGTKTCITGEYEGKNLLPGFDIYKDTLLTSCAPEKWATYKTNLGLVIDEIDKIREGRPLILRMTDFYIPVHAMLQANGVDDVCTACVGAFSEAIRQVADEYGVPVADTLVGLNGKDYTSEIPEEYLMDGIHPSDAGAQFIATLLQKTGYEYAGK